MGNQEEGSLVLGSKKFQKKTKRGRYMQKVTNITRSFIDQQTGLLKTELIKRRICPTCKEEPETSRIIMTKDGFTYRKCGVCNVVYVSPILKENVLIEMYKKSDYAKGWMQVLLNPVEQKFNQSKFEQGIKQIEEIIGRKGKILDVGCAVGQFLNIAKKVGWEVTGTELNKEECAYCQNMGLKVLDKPLTIDLFPSDTFDAVTLWEVLEHVLYPKDILKNIYKILKPSGVLLIVVPNLDSLAAQILQEKCNMFLGISHITMFNNTTLTNVLEDEGFNIIHRSTIISEISVTNNYLHYEHPYLGDAECLHSIFKIINAEYIHKHLLGYKLKFIARK